MPKDIPYYWGEGQPKAIRFSYEDSLGGYLHMFKTILNILEVVFESPQVVEPDNDLNFRYALLLEYFYSIHTTRTDFKHIPNVRFDKFASLIQIDQRYIQSWKEEKPKYIESFRIVDGQFKSIMYGEPHLPRNLVFLLDSLKDVLARHQEKVNPLVVESIENKPLPPNFTWESENLYRVGVVAVEFSSAKGNDRRALLKMLVKANGSPVKVKDMEKRIGKTAPNVRIILSQLKDKIQNTNLTLLTDRKGAYRLALKP